MEQLTITKIDRKSTDRDGNQLKTRDGREYSRVGIQVREKEGWLSGFSNYANKDWKEGDVIEVELEDKTGADGTVYHNFKALSQTQLLELRVKKLENAVFNMNTGQPERQEEAEMPEEPITNKPHDEIDVSEIPFN